MSKPKSVLCPECGIPLGLAEECLWLNSGVIVLAHDRLRRQCFIESENLDPTFQLVSKMGVPDIEDLVLEAARTRRASRTRERIPPEVRAMIRNMLLNPDVLVEAMVSDTQLRGFGDCEVLDLLLQGGEKDHATIRVNHTYSKPLFFGAFAGLIEGFLDRRLAFTLRDISPETCEMSVFVTGLADTCSMSFEEKEYCHRDGDIELERCGSCGLPSALSRLQWQLDRSIIKDSFGLRMVLFDPQVLDLIFKELERRSGKTISRAIIEAQCRFLLNSSKRELGPSRREISDELALRGLGNLREFEMDRQGLRVSVENAACHLNTAGAFKALFEGLHGGDSRIEWDISENGDLELDVRP
ncbi:MAG: hypothetical protein A2V52_03885 [Actinobacteria bacterium RBG_19FT_COMBO_54_7]|uniref:Uncharacterized protein n=1 Tax=Candidatus Solincola sediminis TaxID=1797199 RepID=A0A1F2WF67_9ACTN|nr:MAG: hypothetical protein A2Y75_09245 [Candidatus Solincola sediminis]OFW57819.1 MAG: hypothetical protein A2W01_05240 [Candidatus Solincola sediminis]OFW68566.1 MAG: hypothetical protein A2V52_03885 [Actinobacteria bacterium RBG_19FT_COMBO_54_7]